VNSPQSESFPRLPASICGLRRRFFALQPFSQLLAFAEMHICFASHFRDRFDSGGTVSLKSRDLSEVFGLT
jgi:hypothetical protein